MGLISCDKIWIKRLIPTTVIHWKSILESNVTLSLNFHDKSAWERERELMHYACEVKKGAVGQCGNGGLDYGWETLDTALTSFKASLLAFSFLVFFFFFICVLGTLEPTSLTTRIFDCRHRRNTICPLCVPVTVAQPSVNEETLDRHALKPVAVLCRLNWTFLKSGIGWIVGLVTFGLLIKF